MQLFFLVLVLGIAVSFSFYLSFLKFDRHRALREVSANEVCMLDDEYAESGLLPISLDGKTYYCCIPDCATHLKEDGPLQYATDPVSGKRLDKADAMYGSSKQGRIYYFENAENLQQFRP